MVQLATEKAFSYRNYDIFGDDGNRVVMRGVTCYSSRSHLFYSSRQQSYGQIFFNNDVIAYYPPRLFLLREEGVEDRIEGCTDRLYSGKVVTWGTEYLRFSL